MTDEEGQDVRQTLVSTLVAGAVALLALVALTMAGLGSGTVQAVVAVALGVVAGQVYERTR